MTMTERCFAAILFDLDGVLVDSEPVHYAAEVELLGRHGFVLDQPTWQTMKGLTDAVLFARLRALGLAARETDAELARQKLDILLRLLPERLRPFPAAVETVRALAGRRLALTTSSPRPMAELALRLIGLERAFAVVVTGDDVRRGKPHPEPFLTTAARLGLPPGRCAVIEDSVHGVAAALAAGMTCIAVEHSFPACELGAAQRVVPCVADVPAALRLLENGARWAG